MKSCRPGKYLPGLFLMKSGLAKMELDKNDAEQAAKKSAYSASSFKEYIVETSTCLLAVFILAVYDAELYVLFLQFNKVQA